ncbi:MAG: phospholipase D family protein, partial [Acidobacteria bacterium]|nr:phospholipase D family protein [Acidobacteriota bacterium]
AVAAASSTTLESFFSPNGGIAARIVQEIERTRTSIDIAIYSFTRNEIADALIAAKNRGVAIRILADSGQAPGSGSEIARLEAAGFALKRTAGVSGSGIMHNKYALFDGSVLLTGSYNWSTNAEENSFENAVFIRNAAAISAYQANFNSIWNTRR